MYFNRLFKCVKPQIDYLTHVQNCFTNLLVIKRNGNVDTMYKMYKMYKLHKMN